MNYLLRFGIEYNPFIKNNDNININLENTNQLLFRLNHLLQTKGIALITGEPGLGKSTAIRHWCETLNTNLYKVIYISHTTVSVFEFYKEIADKLGLEVLPSKRRNLNNIQKEIERLSIEKKITPIFILDEANYLSSAILNDLKILLNFKMDSKEPYILLLIGQSVIRNTLNMRSNEPLRQRISMNFSFRLLDKEESKKYIDGKLKISGLHNNTKLLTDEAYNQIIARSNGTPRLINQIMNKALLLLENRKADIIDEDIMMSAIDETSI